MIKKGMAWVFPKYNRRDDLPVLQQRARQEKLGIWNLPETEKIPPWEWRKQRKKQKNLTNSMPDI